jgi:hypothetical protein
VTVQLDLVSRGVSPGLWRPHRVNACWTVDWRESPFNLSFARARVPCHHSTRWSKACHAERDLGAAELTHASEPRVTYSHSRLTLAPVRQQSEVEWVQSAPSSADQTAVSPGRTVAAGSPREPGLYPSELTFLPNLHWLEGATQLSAGASELRERLPECPLACVVDDRQATLLVAERSDVYRKHHPNRPQPPANPCAVGSDGRFVDFVFVATRICPLAANRSSTVTNAQSGEFEVRLNYRSPDSRR